MQFKQEQKIFLTTLGFLKLPREVVKRRLTLSIEGLRFTLTPNGRRQIQIENFSGYKISR